MTLEVKNLHKHYENREVLKGINFTVNDGDVVAVLGPSGSGKTTILRCINFLEKANEGELIFDGEHFDLAKITKKEIKRLRMKTAFVFQNYNLFLNNTVLENVTLGLIHASGVSRKDAEEKAVSVPEKNPERSTKITIAIIRGR